MDKVGIEATPVPEAVTVFVNRRTGSAVMGELRYETHPALTDIHIEEAVVLDGYEIPRYEADRVFRRLQAAGVQFQLPQGLSLSGLGFGSQLAAGAGCSPSALRWSACEKRLVTHRVCTFLDVAATFRARATFYNTKEEQAKFEERVHRDVFDLDRGVYTALLSLPGVSNRARQVGVMRLLSTPRAEGNGASSETIQETAHIEQFVRRLPPPAMLKLFGVLRTARVNNARTRKVILRTILSRPQIELWSVRYRRKLKSALQHALGTRVMSITAAIPAKQSSDRTNKENRLLLKHLASHAGGRTLSIVYECVAFIFGHESHLTLPSLIAYRDARGDLEAGRVLPFETLEGIRSGYHKDRTTAEVLALTRDQLTRGQKIAMQRQGDEAGISIEFDPAKYDAVQLYSHVA